MMTTAKQNRNDFSADLIDISRDYQDRRQPLLDAARMFLDDQLLRIKQLNATLSNCLYA